MNEAAPEPAVAQEDEFTGVLDEGNGLLEDLGLPWERLLNVEAVSYATGVAPERVQARLSGAPPGELSGRFCERLRFLHETRLNHKGKKHSLRTIARAKEVNVSVAAVSYLLSGRNEPGRDAAAGLERFFGVPVGWCSLSEGEALAGYVRPRLQQLKIVKMVAEAQARGVESVAARSTVEVRGDHDLLLEVLPEVLAAVDHVHLPTARGERQTDS